MLSKGCDILVATPRRLIDMLRRSYVNGVKTLALDKLSQIVYDEADELLSKDFAGQIQQIHDMALFPGDLNHWFFSSQYLAEHITKAKSIMAEEYLDISFDMPDENTAMRYSLVKQHFIEVGEGDTERFAAIPHILAQNKRTKNPILCETHASVEFIHNSLARLNLPFRSTRGGYSQEMREEAILKFKRGAVAIFVSTMGVGGRGLNLQGVDCLTFWEMPDSLEQYKWCLGRVGQ